MSIHFIVGLIFALVTIVGIRRYSSGTPNFFPSPKELFGWVVIGYFISKFVAYIYKFIINYYDSNGLWYFF